MDPEQKLLTHFHDPMLLQDFMSILADDNSATPAGTVLSETLVITRSLLTYRFNDRAGIYANLLATIARTIYTQADVAGIPLSVHLPRHEFLGSLTRCLDMNAVIDH